MAYAQCNALHIHSTNYTITIETVLRVELFRILANYMQIQLKYRIYNYFPWRLLEMKHV